MAKAELKTKVNEASVTKFLDSVTDEQKRNDCFEILKLMKQVTKEEPKMWGSSIVGFGEYHYKYESGREGDSPLIGLASRAQNIVLYMPEEFPQREELLARFGKHSTGKVCIYINKLADVDLDILRKLVKNALKKHKRNSS